MNILQAFAREKQTLPLEYRLYLENFRGPQGQLNGLGDNFFCVNPYFLGWAEIFSKISVDSPFYLGFSDYYSTRDPAMIKK